MSGRVSGRVNAIIRATTVKEKNIHEASTDGVASATVPLKPSCKLFAIPIIDGVSLIWRVRCSLAWDGPAEVGAPRLGARRPSCLDLVSALCPIVAWPAATNGATVAF